MNDFTFEGSSCPTAYETYEWDNTWIDHANDPGAVRILHIGDSISCATRRIATEVAEGKLLFDGFGTSKGIDNHYFKDCIRLFAAQQPGRAAVVFNNGLHGWHLDVQAYGRCYEDMICFLRNLFPDTPLFLGLTTAIAPCRGNDRVKKENRQVMELAEKYDLPVIDLYAASKGFLGEDGIHLTKDGYEALAKEIVKKLTENGI